MEKMFVYPESLDSVAAEGVSIGDIEPVRSKAGIVSYQCKVYRALLEQGIASRNVGPSFVSRSRGTSWGIQKPSHG